MQLATQLAILATCVAGLSTLDLRNATATLNKTPFRILGMFSYLIKFVGRSTFYRGSGFFSGEVVLNIGGGVEIFIPI